MRRLLVLAIFICMGTLPNASLALEMPNLMVNTPVGSWVKTENTIQRGRKSEILYTTKSLVGEEMLQGKRHLWVEIKTEVFKVNRKGKKKAKGDPVIVKMLSEASLFEGNPTNAIANFRSQAKKLYIKTGDNVMDMSGGGAFADAMLKSSAASIDFKMTDLHKTRSIDTPFGNVTAHGYKGIGDAQVKVIIKTITTHSEADIWASKEVPFGMVETQSVTTINGKSETSSSKIIAGGMSGAKSEVDISTAQENPMNAFKFGRK